MRHQQNRFAAAPELRELVETLVREPFVANRQDLVHQEHVGVDVNCHREPEPHVHAGRVGLHRRVDELFQLGELHDLVEPTLDVALRQAEHDAVDEHVLAAGDFRMKAGAELDERRDAAVDAHDAAGRLRDACDELQRRALARSVPADDAVGRSLRHGERDVGERRKRLARLQVAHEAALQQRALERRELTAGVAAIDLRDVRQRDRWSHRRYDTERRENTETINHRDTETQRRLHANTLGTPVNADRFGGRPAQPAGMRA